MSPQPPVGLAARVLDFFVANAHEVLIRPDIAAKFDEDVADVDTLLAGAVDAQLLRLAYDADLGAMAYSAGPRLRAWHAERQAARAKKPAAKQPARKTPADYAPGALPDEMELTVDDVAAHTGMPADWIDRSPAFTAAARTVKVWRGADLNAQHRAAVAELERLQAAMDARLRALENHQ